MLQLRVGLPVSPCVTILTRLKPGNIILCNYICTFEPSVEPATNGTN